jgi:hypothetical protein
VVVKAECHAAGTNRRAVVTNQSGAPVVPQGVYDDYVERGESENRNKELKGRLPPAGCRLPVAGLRVFQVRMNADNAIGGWPESKRR